MNMQTQAMLAANRQQQAAFDAQFASWQANSDAQHAAFRARENAQFNGDYGGASAPDYSEAIRGVNTFMTSDGREVELDVSASRTYENQAGDVIGGSDGFDPGADWTEIPAPKEPSENNLRWLAHGLGTDPKRGPGPEWPLRSRAHAANIVHDNGVAL